MKIVEYEGKFKVESSLGELFIPLGIVDINDERCILEDEFTTKEDAIEMLYVTKWLCKLERKKFERDQKDYDENSKVVFDDNDE